jgi:hypothetical protein
MNKLIAGMQDADGWYDVNEWSLIAGMNKLIAGMNMLMAGMTRMNS